MFPDVLLCSFPPLYVLGILDQGALYIRGLGFESLRPCHLQNGSSLLRAVLRLRELAPSLNGGPNEAARSSAGWFGYFSTITFTGTTTLKLPTANFTLTVYRPTGISFELLLQPDIP